MIVSGTKHSSVLSSAHMILFSTAILPFIIPFKLRVMTIAQNDRLSPNAIADIVEPTQPMMRTGFRPIRSDSAPQWKTVRSCVMENIDSTYHNLSIMLRL
jgi:hypothetical protein